MCLCPNPIATSESFSLRVSQDANSILSLTSKTQITNQLNVTIVQSIVEINRAVKRKCTHKYGHNVQTHAHTHEGTHTQLLGLA